MPYNLYVPTIEHHIIHSPLDDMIPFIEYFVLPYDLWYFYIAAVVIFFFFKNKRDYLRTNFMLITGMVTSMIICYLYPTMHDLRPDFDALGRSNIFIDLVKWLYSTDEPAVIFPSMHCVVAILLAVSVCVSQSLKGKTAVKIAAWVLTTLICAATVFIKQHSILDVFMAVGVSVAVYVVSIFLFRKKDSQLPKTE